MVNKLLRQQVKHTRDNIKYFNALENKLKNI
jgi:hypothetical protein